MITQTLTTRIDRPAGEVTAWLARPAAASRATPPWAVDAEHLQIFSTAIKSLDAASCSLTEEIRVAQELEIPAATIGRFLACRHAIIRGDIEQTAAHGVVRRLRIAIAGASGMIGRAFIPFLQTQNHEVVPLARDPATGAFSPEYLAQTLAGADAIINLAGAGIAAKWTQAQRDLIWESRASTTRALVSALGKMKHRPFAFLNASATGYYGTRGDEILNETAPRGAGFLADVCAGWEHEASAAAESGTRVACLRFGMVLSPAGGALAAMLPYFEKKLGGKLGHGRQWTSWVSIDDAVAAIYHALLTHTCSGPVNITAPNPVTNARFTATLARALGKKSIPCVPRWLVRLRHGIDFANEMLLASARVEPAKLQAGGFAFRHPTLESAFEQLL